MGINQKASFLICFVFFFFCSSNKRCQRHRPDLPLPATTNVFHTAYSIKTPAQCLSFQQYTTETPVHIFPSSNTQSERPSDGSPSSSSIVRYSILNKSMTTTAGCSPPSNINTNPHLHDVFPSSNTQSKRSYVVFFYSNIQRNTCIWQHGIFPSSNS